MKKILLLLLFIPNLILAQQTVTSKYNFDDFNLIVKVEDQEEYYEEMLERLSPDNIKPALRDAYLTTLAVGWLAKGNLEKFQYYLKSNPEISYVTLLNLTYALEKLEHDSNYMTVVQQVSKQIIDKLENDVNGDNMNGGRLQVLLELNAMANARLGNVDVALKNMEKASSINGDRDINYFKDSKSNYYNRYAIVLSAAGQNQKALDTLTHAVRNADSNPKLIETLRDVYKKVHGSDSGLEQYISSLKEEAYNKYYKEVEKLYIPDTKLPMKGYMSSPDDKRKKMTLFTANEHIYNISLPDPDDRMIKFSDYKDKIIVVDFWSTLCTPCVAAFAGFERMVAEYKNDPFQLFVINLFEDQETVNSFIAKKGITLDVLMDQPNEKYNIQGTPTKIVFDTKGNIRFYSAGYAGSTDREYYKLKAMVEIVKSRTKD